MIGLDSSMDFSLTELEQPAGDSLCSQEELRGRVKSKHTHWGLYTAMSEANLAPDSPHLQYQLHYILGERLWGGAVH